MVSSFWHSSLSSIYEEVSIVASFFYSGMPSLRHLQITERELIEKKNARAILKFVAAKLSQSFHIAYR